MCTQGPYHHQEPRDLPDSLALPGGCMRHCLEVGDLLPGGRGSTPDLGKDASGARKFILDVKIKPNF